MALPVYEIVRFLVQVADAGVNMEADNLSQAQAVLWLLCALFILAFASSRCFLASLETIVWKHFLAPRVAAFTGNIHGKEGVLGVALADSIS